MAYWYEKHQSYLLWIEFSKRALVTSSHKSWGKSTDAFNIEKRKIHLKHKPRGRFWDISGWTSGNFSCLIQETDRAWLFQFREIFWETFHESFSYYFFSWVVEIWPKRWWISWERVCFESPQTVSTTIFLSLWGLILKISSWRQSRLLRVWCGDLQELTWWSTKSQCSRGSDVTF